MVMIDDLGIAMHSLVRPRLIAALANDERVKNLAQRHELLDGLLPALARMPAKEADSAAV